MDRNFYNTYMEFKEILLEYLEVHGLTQTQFAETIKVKPSQVNEWLKGKAKPGYDMMKRILTQFEESAEYWFDIR